MSEHGLSDSEPTAFDDEHGSIGIFQHDEIIPLGAVNAYTDANIPSHLGDYPTTTPKSSTILRWSFGFSTEYVSNMLRSIPTSLKSKLNAICVTLDTVPRNSEVWERNQKHKKQCTEQIAIPNVDNAIVWRNVQCRMVDDKDRCAMLRISFEGLFFNSKLSDILALDAVALDAKSFSSGTAFPFHIIDYLCIIVHDIEHSFDEATIRYCRVISPNIAQRSAQLVCMITRREFDSSGALSQVHPLHLSYNT
jgi:hypothetical protein